MPRLSRSQWADVKASLEAHPKAIDAFIAGVDVLVHDQSPLGEYLYFRPENIYTIPRPTQEINGVTLEAPLTLEELRRLGGNYTYFTEDPTSFSLFQRQTYTHHQADHRWISRKLAYPTSEAASAACRARYNITA